MLKKHIIFLCIIYLLIFFGGLTVHASETYGFEPTILSEYEKNSIWEKINFLSISDSITLNDVGAPIVSFDVSESERILLGFKGNKVAILDKNMKIINVFVFSNYGSYYVRWNGNNILLLLVRGSIIVEITTTGELVNIVKADCSSSHNNSQWNKLSKKCQVYIGENIYSVRNNMGLLNFFLSSYSQLIKSDMNGNTTILYDVNSTQLTKNIVIISACVLFVVIVLTNVVRQFLKTKAQ